MKPLWAGFKKRDKTGSMSAEASTAPMVAGTWTGMRMVDGRAWLEVADYG